LQQEKGSEGKREKLLKMEERLHHRIDSQERAITAVANAIRRARAGLQEETRPIGSSIFLGPTGGGKTELARALAEFLFDEIEKAHHDVFNVLLLVLDDGRITEGQGRTVDFKNTVIIMTSNIGSQHILDASDNVEQREARVMEALRGHFRPEFLNRVDDIIMFDRLRDTDLKHIVEIQLVRLVKRLA